MGYDFRMFIDKVSGGNRSVPGNRALRFERGYRCDVSRDVSSRTNLLAMHFTDCNPLVGWRRNQRSHESYLQNGEERRRRGG